MTTYSERIGKNLKKARRALGLSQQQVAVEAGVSVGTVAKYEQGKTENPRGDEFDRVARAVGKTADDLRGVLSDLPGERDDDPPDTFHHEMARRYGPENAAFVDEVARKIQEFPPRDAAFARNFLMGALHGARNPWRARPDGDRDTAHLVHTG